MVINEDNKTKNDLIQNNESIKVLQSGEYGQLTTSDKLKTLVSKFVKENPVKSKNSEISSSNKSEDRNN